MPGQSRIWAGIFLTVEGTSALHLIWKNHQLLLHLWSLTRHRKLYRLNRVGLCIEVHTWYKSFLFLVTAWYKSRTLIAFFFPPFSLKSNAAAAHWFEPHMIPCSPSSKHIGLFHAFIVFLLLPSGMIDGATVFFLAFPLIDTFLSLGGSRNGYILLFLL